MYVAGDYAFSYLHITQFIRRVKDKAGYLPAIEPDFLPAVKKPATAKVRANFAPSDGDTAKR